MMTDHRENSHHYCQQFFSGLPSPDNQTTWSKESRMTVNRLVWVKLPLFLLTDHVLRTLFYIATLNDITLDPMNIHKKQTNIPNNMNSSHKNQPVLELVLWLSVKMHWLTQLNFCLKSCCHFLKLDTEEKILLTLYKEFSFFSNAWCWRRRIKLFFWISWTLQKEFPKN